MITSSMIAVLGENEKYKEDFCQKSWMEETTLDAYW